MKKLFPKTAGHALTQSIAMQVMEKADVSIVWLSKTQNARKEVDSNER